MEYEVSVWAAYCQFYVRDKLADIFEVVNIATDFDFSNGNSHDRAGFGSNSIVFMVPDRDDLTTQVTVAILEVELPYNKDEWDAIEDGSITVIGEHLLVEMARLPESPQLPITPGTYAVRVVVKALAAAYQNFPGAAERYRVELWPAASRPHRVIKRFSGD